MSDPNRAEATPPSPSLITPRRLVTAAALVVPLAVVLPLLLGGSDIVQSDPYRAYDWLEAAKYRWYAREAWLAGSGLPAWNPYFEGGIPSWAHPSDGSSSPFFLTNLLFGVAWGMKLDVAILLVLGSLGTLGLARDWLGLRGLPAAVAAASFAVAGWTASGVAVGFYESLYLCIVPPVLWLLWKSGTSAERRPAALLLAAAVLLLSAAAVQMQLCLPFALLECALWAAVAGGQAGGPSRKRLLGSVLLLAGGVALLGMYKFLPMMEFLASRGWRIEQVTEPHFWGTALVNLALGLFATAAPAGEYLADSLPTESEYSYVGLPLSVGLLALLAMAQRAPRERGLALLLGITVFLSWDPGPGFQPSLFAPLHHLPVFSSIREPTRYVTFFALLWLALLGGAGLRCLLSQEKIGGRLRQALVVAALVLILLQGLTSAGLFGTLLRKQAPDLAEALPPAILSAEGWQQLQLTSPPRPDREHYDLLTWTAPQAGIGLVYRAEDLPAGGPPPAQGRWLLHPEHAPRPNPAYRGEAWIRAGSGRVLAIAPGFDTLELEVELEAGAELGINQNHHPGWQGPEGVEVLEREGLLALRLAKAHSGPVTLQFAPRSMRLGARVSALSALLMLLALVGAARRPAARPSAEQAGGSTA